LFRDTGRGIDWLSIKAARGRYNKKNEVLFMFARIGAAGLFRIAVAPGAIPFYASIRTSRGRKLDPDWHCP
jgi:hypothetical protein